MNPRLTARIITDAIYLDLIQFKRNVRYFLDVFIFVEDRNNHFRKRYFNTERQAIFTYFYRDNKQIRILR